MMIRPAKSPQDQQCIQYSDKSARLGVTDNGTALGPATRFPKVANRTRYYARWAAKLGRAVAACEVRRHDHVERAGKIAGAEAARFGEWRHAVEGGR
jgi:hypothetical protein